jgi:hypothetical protein
MTNRTVADLVEHALTREPGEFGAVFGELMRGRLVEAVSSRKREIAEGLLGGPAPAEGTEEELAVGDELEIDETLWTVREIKDETIVLEDESGAIEELSKNKLSAYTAAADKDRDKQSKRKSRAYMFSGDKYDDAARRQDSRTKGIKLAKKKMAESVEEACRGNGVPDEAARVRENDGRKAAKRAKLWKPKIVKPVSGGKK